LLDTVSRVTLDLGCDDLCDLGELLETLDGTRRGTDTPEITHLTCYFPVVTVAEMAIYATDIYCASKLTKLIIYS